MSLNQNSSTPAGFASRLRWISQYLSPCLAADPPGSRDLQTHMARIGFPVISPPNKMMIGVLFSYYKPSI